MLLLFRLVNQVAKNTIISLLVNDKYATNCRSDQLTTTNCRSTNCRFPGKSEGKHSEK